MYYYIFFCTGEQKIEYSIPGTFEESFHCKKNEVCDGIAITNQDGTEEHPIKWRWWTEQEFTKFELIIPTNNQLLFQYVSKRAENANIEDLYIIGLKELLYLEKNAKQDEKNIEIDTQCELGFVLNPIYVKAILAMDFGNTQSSFIIKDLNNEDKHRIYPYYHDGIFPFFKSCSFLIAKDRVMFGTKAYLNILSQASLRPNMNYCEYPKRFLTFSNSRQVQIPNERRTNISPQNFAQYLIKESISSALNYWNQKKYVPNRGINYNPEFCYIDTFRLSYPLTMTYPERYQLYRFARNAFEAYKQRLQHMNMGFELPKIELKCDESTAVQSVFSGLSSRQIDIETLGNVVTIDIGGGTTDLAQFFISQNGKINVIGHSSLVFGGGDIKEYFTKYLITKIEKTLNIENFNQKLISFNSARAIEQKISELAEQNIIFHFHNIDIESMINSIKQKLLPIYKNLNIKWENLESIRELRKYLEPFVTLLINEKNLEMIQNIDENNFSEKKMEIKNILSELLRQEIADVANNKIIESCKNIFLELSSGKFNQIFNCLFVDISFRGIFQGFSRGKKYIELSETLLKGSNFFLDWFGYLCRKNSDGETVSIRILLEEYLEQYKIGFQNGQWINLKENKEDNRLSEFVSFIDNLVYNHLDKDQGACIRTIILAGMTSRNPVIKKLLKIRNPQVNIFNIKDMKQADKNIKNIGDLFEVKDRDFTNIQANLDKLAVSLGLITLKQDLGNHLFQDIIHKNNTIITRKEAEYKRKKLLETGREEAIHTPTVFRLFCNFLENLDKGDIGCQSNLFISTKSYLYFYNETRQPVLCWPENGEKEQNPDLQPIVSDPEAPNFFANNSFFEFLCKHGYIATFTLDQPLPIHLYQASYLGDWMAPATPIASIEFDGDHPKPLKISIAYPTPGLLVIYEIKKKNSQNQWEVWNTKNIEVKHQSYIGKDNK